jgi:TRAP-type C4-dicarboxylate transport system permease small subunit
MMSSQAKPLYAVVLEGMLVACMVLMVVMVFGNVVLRYGFNSGIAVSEEVSRLLFVWLTFLGAIVAMREKAHLGVDTLLRKLGPGGRRACALASQLLMLLCCAIVAWGGWRVTLVSLDSEAAVSGISNGWVYASVVVAAVGIGSILLHGLWRLLTGRVADDELVMVAESEERLPVPGEVAEQRKDTP